MGKLGRGLCVLVSVALSAAVSAGQLPPDLERAVREWDQAQIDGNLQALRRLISDDYTLVNSHGVVETKAQYIAEATAPGFKLQPFVVREPIEKIWSGGAVRGGLVLANFTEGGHSFRRWFRFADVWMKRDGHWQVIYTGVTRVENPTSP